MITETMDPRAPDYYLTAEREERAWARLKRFAREAFERKFGDGPGIWLENFELIERGRQMLIRYGSGESIFSFTIQIPTNAKK